MKTIRKITVLLLSGLLAMSQPVQHTAFAQGEEIPETEHTAEPELSGETENSPEPADENTEPALTEENGNAQGEETPGQEQPEEPVSSGEPEDSPDAAAEPGTAGETENSPEPADEITEPAPAEGNGNAQAETPDEQKADMDTAEPAEESREQEETRDAGNNWSLDIVFFDSEVDNGHTALTAVDWNATTDHVNVLPARTIKVQITYRNTNSEKAYAPGELTLTIPNMMAGQGNSGNTSAYTSNSSHMNWTVDIPANDATHSGFDWTLANGKNADVYQFTNDKDFEENLNFEGTITLTYTLTPMGEFSDEAHRADSNYPMDELYVDSCTHSTSADLQAEMTETGGSTPLAESDEITFDYERFYDHPWTRTQYTLDKNASRVTSMELLGENADDYIWVRYDFVPNPRSIRTVSGWYFYLVQRYQQALGTIPGPSTAYPLIGAYEAYITDTFPEECIVLDRNHNPMPQYSQQGEDGITYRIEPYGRHPVLETGDGSFMAYVGYPKSIYNEENGNLHITNTADLIGRYGDRTNMEVLATGDVSLDLSDFEFIYQGDLFRVDKYVYMYSNSNYYHYGHNYTRTYLRDLRYQDILNDYEYDTATWYLRPTVRYPGFAYDMVIGDDLLYSTDLNGNVSRVPDEDYYFQTIRYSPTALHNTSGSVIQTDRYDCELWVRRAGSPDTEYELVDSFRNGLKTSWTFTEADAVVGFKFVVHDCQEGFTPATGDAITCTTVFHRQDIPRDGFLHNFDYLEIWKDVNGEMVQLNEPGIDSYATDYTQQEIAAFDQDTYGHYLQRGTDRVHWQFYDVPKFQAYLTARKQRLGTVVQEAENKRYTGRFQIAAGYGNRRMYYPEYHDDYLTNAHKAYLLHGFLFYDLLPEGMELLSTPEEIAASMELGYDEMGWWADGTFNPINQDSYSTIRDENLNEIRWDEFEALCRENLTVTVERNWNGTNRTKITVDVDLSEHPFYITSHTDNTQTIWSSRLIGVEYRYALPYESLEDYGTNYTNSVYADTIPGDITTLDGSYNDVYDLNENGSKTDRMTKRDVSVSVSYDSASLQGLTKSVETDQTPFTTTEAVASIDSDYRYRLRMRTGMSKVTNMVIYDTCEGMTYFPDGSKQHASDGNPYWQGTIRGVDTSFAEKQGWTVNVYWSPSEDPGTLAEDDSWQPYTAETDASAIRAFAFEFLDRNGQPAVLDANYSTQVEILMHSPEAGDGVNTKTEKAYNGSWARWNALDEHDNVIPFIEGIQSNITRVAMNEQIEVTVRKEWDSDYEDVRPASVTVELLADGESAGSAVLNADNDWSWTFTDLWKYNDDGSLVAYSVYEPEVPDGYTVSYTDGKGATHISAQPQAGYLTAVNTYQRKKLRGVKRWDGDKSSDRPASITVHLFRNGEEIAETATTAANNWKYEFLVDIYDENGEEYEYTIVEDVPEGYRENYEKDPDHPVTIRFDSRSRTDSNRYDFVRFYYMQNGTLYYTNTYGSTFPSTVNLPTSEFWIYWHTSYSDNQYYGFRITSIDDYTGTYFASASQATRLPNYTVQELGSDLPESEHNPYPNEQNILWKYSGPDFTVNNEYVVTSLSGRKAWAMDRPENRPSSITVELLQNGEVYDEKTVTAADNWAYTFSMLPRFDENDEEYVYTV
ncbi:MAG: Cna B-type domain-containing protein, partial [Solobacterium sp.]|nr:Cna B-type domain-containing protein [Solobacterium sp.]